MVSRKFIFWDVDTQVDFLLRRGKLYVKGAEKLLPNFELLTAAARRGDVFLVSDACVHFPDDPEFQRFPPHCLRGTPGAALVPETMANKFYVIPNRAGVKVPATFSKVQQVILEKQTLNVFDNPNTETVIERLKAFTDPDAEFAVFGVVTEFCVRLAAMGLLERGRRVALITDAIESMDSAAGEAALAELTAQGARLVTTAEILALVERSVSANAEDHRKPRPTRAR